MAQESHICSTVQNSDGCSKSPFVAGKSEEESPLSPNVTQKEKKTMKGEHMHVKIHRETGYALKETLMGNRTVVKIC